MINIALFGCNGKMGQVISNLLSNDAENWVSVDYQPDCNENIASFYIGDCTARYLLFKGYIVDDGDGTVRLYEFQLYKQ